MAPGDEHHMHSPSSNSNKRTKLCLVGIPCIRLPRLAMSAFTSFFPEAEMFSFMCIKLFWCISYTPQKIDASAALPRVLTGLTPGPAWTCPSRESIPGCTTHSLSLRTLSVRMFNERKVC
jgi:hypothetical protein